MNLSAVIGRYPHTLPLLSGQVSDPAIALEFAEIKPDHPRLRADGGATKLTSRNGDRDFLAGQSVRQTW